MQLARQFKKDDRINNFQEVKYLKQEEIFNEDDIQLGRVIIQPLSNDENFLQVTFENHKNIETRRFPKNKWQLVIDQLSQTSDGISNDAELIKAVSNILRSGHGLELAYLERDARDPFVLPSLSSIAKLLSPEFVENVNHYAPDLSYHIKALEFYCILCLPIYTGLVFARNTKTLSDNLMISDNLTNSVAVLTIIFPVILVAIDLYMGGLTLQLPDEKEKKLVVWREQQAKELAYQAKVKKWQDHPWIKTLANGLSYAPGQSVVDCYSMRTVAYLMLISMALEFSVIPLHMENMKTQAPMVYLLALGIMLYDAWRKTPEQRAELQLSHQKALATVPASVEQGYENGKGWAKGLLAAIGCCAAEKPVVSAAIQVANK